jgi:chloramphenicol-sensitive protein RarD
MTRREDPAVERLATPGQPDVGGGHATPTAGYAAAVTAYVIWGFMPLYFKALAPVPPLAVIAHRALWCCVLVAGWLTARGEFQAIGHALRNRRTRALLALSALLISVNWLTYVWGVAHARVVEASLGYFINPLLNVALGVVFLRERLTRAQWIAVALALAGVAYLTIVAGHLPWIALVLAVSFGFYGFTRKLVDVPAVAGLAAETALVAPFAAAYLVWAGWYGGALPVAATTHATTLALLLVGSGLVTALPLALFAFGARLIPYSTIGIIQYIGPTLQLLLGVFAFGEPFAGERAIGFILIWVALAIYLGESLWRARRSQRLVDARASRSGVV